MSHSLLPVESAPVPSSSVASMNLWRASTLMRSAIHVMAALVVSIAMPATAQLSGVARSAIPMQFNVESVEVEGAFLRNGVPFPADFLDSGNLHIESGEGDPILLGNSFNGGYGPLRVVSGLYEPQFTSLFETATAPRGDRVPFSVPLTIDANQILNLDVPAVQVSLTFLLNGATFPSSVDQIADFLLRHRDSGREVNVGSTEQAGSTFYVVPGVYDVIYEHRLGTLIPANTRTVVLENILIDQTMSLDIDVPMVFRIFTYMLNGVAFPNSGLDFGHILLEDPSTEASFFVGETSATTIVRVITGTYRVIYSYRQTQGLSPRNPWAVLDEALVIASGGPSVVEVEVTAHTVDPVFLMDGFTFPGNGLAYGLIQFRAGDGTFVSLGRSDQVAAPEVMVEGSYDFYYELQQSDPAVPSNPLTRFATGVAVNGPGPLPLNVETAVLDLDVLLDGAAFPVSGLNYGRILLVDSETGAERDLGRSYEGPFLERFILGEYDVVYNDAQSNDGTTPMNSGHVVARGLQLSGPSSTSVDIQTQLLAPRFSLNGVEFPDVVSDHGRFFLRDEDGDEVPLGDSHVDAPDLRVIEGTYRVDYEWQSGLNVPANPRETVEIVSVPEPGFRVGLFISALWLSGLAKRRSLTQAESAA